MASEWSVLGANRTTVPSADVPAFKANELKQGKVGSMSRTIEVPYDGGYDMLIAARWTGSTPPVLHINGPLDAGRDVATEIVGVREARSQFQGFRWIASSTADRIRFPSGPPARYVSIKAVDQDVDILAVVFSARYCSGADADADGYSDNVDTCPGADDALEDPDHDEVCGTADNCAHRFNPSQADEDGDGLEDYCDDCIDELNNLFGGVLDGIELTLGSVGPWGPWDRFSKCFDISHVYDGSLGGTLWQSYEASEFVSREVRPEDIARAMFGAPFIEAEQLPFGLVDGYVHHRLAYPDQWMTCVP